jgi:16S rRNA (cytosine1402-N4)-methyltransferase
MDNNSLFFHKPVLVQELLDNLAIKPNGIYLDVTFGSGGHTKAILQADPTVKVIALDWDVQSLECYSPLLKEEFGDRITFIWGSFTHIYKLLKKKDSTLFDGIIADFGTSQMQIFERPGFSLYKDTLLDMRMSPSHHYFTAAHVLNSASVEKLTAIFSHLGGERHARKIAYAIVQDRSIKKFRKTKQLADLIERVIGFGGHSKRQKIHPATRVFQALRIYVNNELDNISTFLKTVPALLKPTARIICISFHSLEDVLVKDFFKDESDKGILTIINKKVITGSEQEIAINPSARSAKMRVAEKIAG